MIRLLELLYVFENKTQYLLIRAHIPALWYVGTSVTYPNDFAESNLSLYPHVFYSSNICEILVYTQQLVIINHALIVRHAGLLWSQQDFEWRWSVPLFKCLTVLQFSFILFDLCLLITFFNFIMNYVPIVTFWIFTYDKIWILSIMFGFIWSYWIIYFLACLEVSWRVVS